MVAYAGSRPSSPIQSDDFYHITDALDQYAVDYWFPHASVTAPGQSAAYTKNYPVSQDNIRNHAGDIAHAFGRDWYDRIHVVPAMINLGNLLSNQTREIEVWNAHFTNKLLSSIDGTGTSGMNLIEPDEAPTTFAPLESRIYHLQISNIGAPTINASFEFNFPGEVPTLQVVGSRVTIWKTRPNWKREVTERWVWLTDVLTAYDNTEQRIKLRDKPRREYEFQVTAWAQERQEMENALWGWQHRVFAVPVWQDQRQLLTSVPAGGSAINLNTTGTEFEEDGLVILANHAGEAEAQEILSLDANSIALKLPLEKAWPSGTYVYPARLGRIGDTQKLTRLTPDIAEMVVNFRFEDGAGSFITAQDSTATYRGLPVLEDKPNWAGDLEAEFYHKISEYDYQTGGVFTEYEGTAPNRLQQFRWFLNGRGAIDRYRKWLYARAGRLTPFWLPSQTPDFKVTQTIGGSSTQITVRNTGYTQYARQQNGRKDIRIELLDGTIHYRRVLDAAILSSTEENLEIDLALSTSVIQPSQIKLVSFLSLSRLDQDQLEIAWKTPQFAESNHLVRTLNYDV
jgi:hypothetical protein